MKLRRLALFVLLSMLAVNIFAQKSINVGVMLPLHDVDGDGRRMVEYYRGMLIAVEKLKSEGNNVNIRAWNVTPDADPTALLHTYNGEKFDVIFGPLYTKHVRSIADYCTINDTKLVIPFSISSNEVDVNPHVFQVYQSHSKQVEQTVMSFVDRFYDSQPVFIECNDTTKTRSAYITPLRKEFDRLGISYRIININAPVDFLPKRLLLDKRNVFILSSERQDCFAKFMKLMDNFTSAYKGYTISVFGHASWLYYENVGTNKSYFEKYDTYIPSLYHYDADSWLTKYVERRYNSYFGVPMLNNLPHFAITGFDHAVYFLGGILNYGNGFVGDFKQSYAAPAQTPLIFEKQSQGGYRNVMYQLVHYLKNGKVEYIRRK